MTNDALVLVLARGAFRGRSVAAAAFGAADWFPAARALTGEDLRAFRANELLVHGSLDWGWQYRLHVLEQRIELLWGAFPYAEACSLAFLRPLNFPVSDKIRRFA